MRLLASIYACAILGSVACSASESDENIGAMTAASAATTGTVVQLAHSPQFVLEKVLEKKRLVFDVEKPIPEIRLASQISLTEFQDAIEPQWGFRPAAVTNAYIVARNVIYLMDDATYYAQHRRCIDDSLAHELTHYVQVRYQGWVLDGMDDSIEMNAIDVQTWFRERFCRR
jgi:hypothetical protein